jgi:hypothetical protein
MSSSSPIFIVGAERSGTTVFRLMLHHHPQISVCSEFEYVVDPIQYGQDFPTVDEFCSELESNWIFQDHKFSADRSLSYGELAQSFLDQLKARDRADYVMAVVHRNFDQLPRLWPNARYLHIVRDPRDVARSVIGMGWAGNVWHGVERWLDVEHTWTDLKAQLPSDRYLEIKQEDLIESPEKTLQQVCQFIGVDYSPRMLDYPHHTTYSAPDPALVGQWRKKLTPKQIGLIESRVGYLLLKRGYPASGHPVVKPSILGQLWLKIDNKLGRLSHRIKTLGIGLFVSDFLSRKLRIKPWQESLEPQLANVWRSSLK